MSHDTTDAETGVPLQFERNRYFHGKLMTARDMAAEQDYVRRRLAALSRTVLGAGVVTGLDVTGVEEGEESISVTLSPGVALDAAGRTVVVPEGTGSVTVRRPGVDDPLPPEEVDADGVALTLRYDHCSTERVPAPGNEHADGDGSEFGRVVETFVVEAEPVEMDDGGNPIPPKPVSEVPLPGPEADPDESGRRMAAEGFDRPAGAVPLVLGTLSRNESDELTIGSFPRPLVYSNDLVYGAAVTHATDRDNPHDVEVGQVEGAISSVGGVEPDADGAIDVRSDNDAVTVEADGNAIVLDSDALRSVVVEGEGTVGGDARGRVRLHTSDPSMGISVDGNRIGLRANALRSMAVEGDDTAVEGGEDRRVTLHSSDGTVTIAPNDAGDRLDFTAAVEAGEVDLEGVLRELQGLSEHGGSIEFASSNDSVDVRPLEEENNVLDVRVTQEFAELLRQRILDDLEGDDGPQFPIDEIRESIREDLRAELTDSIRADIEEDLVGRFDDLNRTNETLLTQLNRLSETADPQDQPVTSLEGVTLENANDLRERGIVSVGDLDAASDEELLGISGVGEVTVSDWRTRVDERIRR
ncbi:MAG: hypothetical protein V5A62_05945 [Haloarculaceae archaeon]